MALRLAKVQASCRLVAVAPSVITSSAVGVKELEVRGSEARGGRLSRRGEPSGGSILIKGPGFRARIKIAAEGRLASICAGVDGPTDSSTAESGCRAIEGIRQTAYDEMRWGDNF